MTHYFPKDDDGTLKLAAVANAFTGPVFVGQGISRRCGSDSHGSFIVSVKKVGKKLVVGICGASSKFINGWTDGSEECFLPNDETDPNKCKAEEWITISGKWKNSGLPKWWYCDENGKKFNGRHADFSWNGAFGYRDPSF